MREYTVVVMYKLKKNTHNYKLNPAFFIELRLVKPMLHSNTSLNVNFFESFFIQFALIQKFHFLKWCYFESYTKLGPLGLVVVVTPPCLFLYNKHL